MRVLKPINHWNRILKLFKERATASKRANDPEQKDLSEKVRVIESWDKVTGEYNIEIVSENGKGGENENS